MNRSQWIIGEVRQRFVWQKFQDIPWGTICRPKSGWVMVTGAGGRFTWKGYIAYKDDSGVTAKVQTWKNYTDIRKLRKDIQEWFIEEI